MPATTSRRQRLALPLAAAAATLLAALALLPPAAQAFLTQHPTQSTLPTALAHTPGGAASAPGGSTTPTRLHGSIEELYNGEPLDPNRRVLKLAYLAASRPTGPPKSEKEKQLEEKVWGRWKMVEESIDRPSPEDLAKHGSKLKPTRSKFEEDLLLDMYNSLMLTKEGTTAYGMGWAWTGIKDVYSAPTLRFRINRKEIGIDQDEYEKIDHAPTVSFYAGTFTDGAFETIEGVVQRNRDPRPPDDGSPPVVVTVGTFKMVKIKAYEL